MAQLDGCEIIQTGNTLYSMTSEGNDAEVMACVAILKEQGWADKRCKYKGHKNGIGWTVYEMGEDWLKLVVTFCESRKSDLMLYRLLLP